MTNEREPTGKPQLALLYATYNRADLFERTLLSLLNQDGRKDLSFEILVLDDGSTDNTLAVVQQYFDRGLPIQYYALDLSRLDVPVFRTSTGANNPAVVNNVGIRIARADWVVLTSPEIIFSRPTNLQRLIDFVSPNPPEESVLVCDVWDPQMKGYICGGPRKRPLHFFCLYNRNFLIKVGGFDEEYMKGWAAEDVDFWVRLERAGAILLMDREIVGYHQSHPRPELHARTSATLAACERNLDLLAAHQADHARRIANVGRDWGSRLLIKDMWPESLKR